jgi:hypothetical protein
MRYPYRLYAFIPSVQVEASRLFFSGCIKREGSFPEVPSEAEDRVSKVRQSMVFMPLSNQMKVRFDAGKDNINGLRWFITNTRDILIDKHVSIQTPTGISWNLNKSLEVLNLVKTVAQDRGRN